jgi:hypothetical protein
VVERCVGDPGAAPGRGEITWQSSDQSQLVVGGGLWPIITGEVHPPRANLYPAHLEANSCVGSYLVTVHLVPSSPPSLTGSWKQYAITFLAVCHLH